MLLTVINRYIKSGVDDGAKIEAGGSRWGEKGFFIQPTILSGASHDMKIMRDEIFGPVCVVSRFETQDEVVQAANATSYGLASGVHTKSIDRALNVSSLLETGTVWVNQVCTHQQSACSSLTLLRASTILFIISFHLGDIKKVESVASWGQLCWRATRP